VSPTNTELATPPQTCRGSRPVGLVPSEPKPRVVDDQSTSPTREIERERSLRTPLRRSRILPTIGGVRLAFRRGTARRDQQQPDEGSFRGVSATARRHRAERSTRGSRFEPTLRTSRATYDRPSRAPPARSSDAASAGEVKARAGPAPPAARRSCSRRIGHPRFRTPAARRRRGCGFRAGSRRRRGSPDRVRS